MNRYDKLVCPTDKIKLVFFPGPLLQVEGNEEGILYCQGCEHLWSVMSGIPRFVTPANFDLNLDIAIFRKEEGKGCIPESILSKNIERLQDWENKNRKNWQSEEMDYWEKYYKNTNTSSDKKGVVLMTYNRLLPRQKHIFEPLKKIESARILEIGCGKATTVAMNPNFLAEKEYVGTDLSFQALLCAKRNVAGLFVLCDAEALPFADHSFDIIFCFGILHHLQRRERVVQKILTFLQPEGWIGIAEKIRLPEKARQSALYKLIWKKLQGLIHSRHSEDEYIELDRLLTILKKDKMNETVHLEYSIVRDLLVKVFVDLLKINNLRLTKSIIYLDEKAIAWLAKKFFVFRPKSCLILAKKK